MAVRRVGIVNPLANTAGSFPAATLSGVASIVAANIGNSPALVTIYIQPSGTVSLTDRVYLCSNLEYNRRCRLGTKYNIFCIFFYEFSL